MEPVPAPDLDLLDDFLSSDASPDDCMQLSDLDGFLTGIAIGPEPIMPSEWLPEVWGGAPPEFTGPDQAATILGAIMGRYNDIIRTLNAHEQLDPLFWENDQEQIIADDWALGFLDAMQMRPEAWRPLLVDKEARILLMPILTLAGDPDMVDEPEEAEIDQAIEMVPMAVAGIRAYWREHGPLGPERSVDRDRPGRGRRAGRR